MGLGIGLRIWQMAGGASLWLDELDVARNIAERSWTGILRPLDYGQVAPLGFLIIVKFLWSVLGRGEWALRLFPFIGAIASVFLFRDLAAKVLRGVAPVLALGLFIICVPLIQESAQVKQYSTDVAIALLLTVLAFQALRAELAGVRLLAIGVAGFAAVFFSNAAVVVVTGLGAALFFLTKSWQPGNGRRVLGLVIVPWAVGAGAATLVSLRAVSPEIHDFMRAYWHEGFVPLHPQSRADVLWLWYALREPFGDMMGYAVPTAFVILELVGLVCLWRRRREAAVLLLAPIVVTLLVALAQQYPFSDRLILFLTPAFFIGVAEGAGCIGSLLSRRMPAVSAAVMVVVAVPAIQQVVTNHPVYRLEESEPLYRWLGTQWRPGDAVFLSLGAVPAFEWYGPKHGVTAQDTVIGGCWPEDPARHMRQMDRLRGKHRAWLVMARTNSFQLDSTWAYADAIGKRSVEFVLAPPVKQTSPLRVRLYDFSDSTRLARAANPDAFTPHLARQFRVGILGCYYGPVAGRRRDADGRVDSAAVRRAGAPAFREAR